MLRGDIFRYFPAIDHEILKRDLRRRIACKRTLWLADAIIDRPPIAFILKLPISYLKLKYHGSTEGFAVGSAAMI